MKEIKTLIGSLAIQSVRYNTFRGKWTDMPDSTGLCLILGILSLLSCFLSIYIRDSLEMAIAIPVVWLAAVWLYASRDRSWGFDKRLVSAAFLLTIPMELILATLGKNNAIELPIDIYMAANMLMLKARE